MRLKLEHSYQKSFCLQQLSMLNQMHWNITCKSAELSAEKDSLRLASLIPVFPFYNGMGTRQVQYGMGQHTHTNSPNLHE